MQVPTSPKGTRDFYPEDMAFQEFIFSSWHRTCRRYGFELFDGPMFESLSVYTEKSGAEIEQQLYAFPDKAGRMMALRPEMTPTLARMVAARGTALKRPIRWYSIPRLFRYEKMQKGRLREFFQLNMDILGADDILADAELIAASIDMMRDLGFASADFTARISSRGLLEQVFASMGVAGGSMPAIYAILDKKHKVPPEEFVRELTEVLPDASQRARVDAVLSARSLEDVRAIAGDLPAIGQLTALLSHLASYGLSEYAEFDVGIVRGLAYYTGIVFEIFDKARSLRAIAGGGRYDHLVKSYGGPDTPAIGFAAGDVVLAELMRAKGIMPPASPRSSVFIAALDDMFPDGTIRLAQTLRAAGVSCEFSLKATGLGKQFKQADGIGARLVVIAGGEEEKQGCVKVKNMGTGAEELVKKEQLVEKIRTDLHS